MLDDWKTFIVAVFIKRTLEVSILACQGCRESRFSPLLHAHQTKGLMQKLTVFFDAIKSELVTNIRDVYSQFEVRFPNINIPNYDQEGIEFLNNLDVNQIYYGRYITADNDLKFYEYEYVQSQTSVKKAKTKVRKSRVGS